MPSIDTETLTSVAKDVLCRLNLPLCKHCGQCCDGASSMRGAGFGVAKRIVDEKPRGVYIHCYGHSVNLAVNDAVKTSKTLQNALETTHEESYIKFELMGTGTSVEKQQQQQH